VFKGLANIGSILKSAREMGGKLQGINEQLKAQRATGNSGGGLVEVEVNGLGELLRVRIDPQLMEQGDLEMLEDMIPAAANQAIARSKQLHAEAVQSMTEGMNLPGLSEALGEVTGGGTPEVPPVDEEPPK
jgi:DNA-binding YbaB/EbfC family protein